MAILYSILSSMNQGSHFHKGLNKVNMSITKGKGSLPVDPLAPWRRAKSCLLPSLVYAALFFAASVPDISCKSKMSRFPEIQVPNLFGFIVGVALQQKLQQPNWTWDVLPDFLFGVMGTLLLLLEELVPLWYPLFQ